MWQVSLSTVPPAAARNFSAKTHRGAREFVLYQWPLVGSWTARKRTRGLASRGEGFTPNGLRRIPFLPPRELPMGSVSYLETVLRLRPRHQLRQLLARIEHPRLHGRLVDANDFGNLLDR